jgi:hypothetical protein
MRFYKPNNLKIGDLVWVRFIHAMHSDVGPPDAWISVVFWVFSNGDILARKPNRRPKYFYKHEVYGKSIGSYNKLRDKIYNSTKIITERT